MYSLNWFILESTDWFNSYYNHTDSEVNQLQCTISIKNTMNNNASRRFVPRIQAITMHRIELTSNYNQWQCTKSICTQTTTNNNTPNRFALWIQPAHWSSQFGLLLVNLNLLYDTEIMDCHKARLLLYAATSHPYHYKSALW